MPLCERPTKVKGPVFKEPIRLPRSTMELAEVKTKKTAAPRPQS
jgi:hypothetical protein